MRGNTEGARPTYTQRAQLEVANLAIAARTGAVSAEGVLMAAGRLGSLLAILADYEAAMDAHTSEAQALELARENQLAAGNVVELRRPRRLGYGRGGNAA